MFKEVIDEKIDVEEGTLIICRRYMALQTGRYAEPRFAYVRHKDKKCILPTRLDKTTVFEEKRWFFVS